MDASKFSDSSPGRLVEQGTPRQDWSFVPAPLPLDISVPRELQRLCSAARQEVGTLDGIGRTLQDPQILLSPLRSREAHASSSIEGTIATPEQVLLFELQPEEPASDRDEVNAWLEVSNYGKAMTRGAAMLGEYPLSLHLVRELHKTLLTGVRGSDKTPGEFRTSQVQIGANARFVPPPGVLVADCLGEFEAAMQEHRHETYDPLVLTFLLHYQFEAVHPFKDGNGRVGRLLITLMSFKWCGFSQPWLFVSSYFERHRAEYIELLFRVSSEGAWQEWLEFCLHATIVQARDATRRCGELLALKQRMFAETSDGHARLHTLVDVVSSGHLITIPQAARLLNVSYNTAKKSVGTLVDRGILAPLQARSRAEIFYSDEFIGIVHSELREE